MSSPSLGWERLRDVYYRNREISRLEWAHGTDSLPELATLAANTRSIACYEPRKYSNGDEFNGDLDDIETDAVCVYSAFGVLLGSITWKPRIQGRILLLSFNGGDDDDENLVIVSSKGVVRLQRGFETGDYDILEIGHGAESVGVKKAGVDAQGKVVVLLNDYKLVRCDFNKRETVLLRDLKDRGESGEFHSWCLGREAVLICLGKEVFKITEIECLKVSVDGPFELMAESSNGKFIGMWNSRGLAIITSQFHKMMDFQCPLPLEMRWCGSDAIVLKYPGSLKLVAPGGELEWFYDDVVINTEIDGLTILTNDTMEFLSKIDDCTVECFKIGSRSKSAILMDAIDKLNNHNPKATENLSIIGDGLLKAVEDCLDASVDEFDPYWQKKLLKAASFGKNELELTNNKESTRITEKFVTICDELRILNMIRDQECGIYLTHKEFKHLGLVQIIKLLNKRQFFSKSFQICKFMDLPLDLIFIDWSCCKIRYSNDLNDEELSQVIISKFQSLKSNKYISFEDIATTAFEEGRNNLAKILINFESNFHKQVSFLIHKMQEIELGFEKAIESQDIDLTIRTILELQVEVSISKFFKLINNSKLASNVFEYMNSNNDSNPMSKEYPRILENFYNQADKTIELTNYQLKQNERYNDIDSLNTSLDVFKSRNPTIHKQLSKQLQLCQLQKELTNEFNVDFDGLSISQTIYKLITLNQMNKTNELMKSFKFPRKKYEYLRLQYYIDLKKFDELYGWCSASLTSSSSNKLQIGYEPIIDECIKAHENQLALKLITKCDKHLNQDQKLEFWIQLHQYELVLEEAIKKKNGELIDRVEELTGSEGEFSRKIREARDRISTSSRFF